MWELLPQLEIMALPNTYLPKLVVIPQAPRSDSTSSRVPCPEHEPCQCGHQTPHHEAIHKLHDTCTTCQNGCTDLTSKTTRKNNENWVVALLRWAIVTWPALSPVDFPQGRKGLCMRGTPRWLKLHCPHTPPHNITPQRWARHVHGSFNPIRHKLSVFAAPDSLESLFRLIYILVLALSPWSWDALRPHVYTYERGRSCKYIGFLFFLKK